MGGERALLWTSEDTWGPAGPMVRAVRARLLPDDAPFTVAEARRAGWSGDDLRAAVPSAVERLPALRARRGLRQVRRVLAIAEPLTESPMESRLRLLLVRAGFPRPEAQYVVRAPSGRFIARVDLAYPDLRVAVEYDGRAAHPVGLARDRERAWELRQAGWVAVHVTAPPYADRERLIARVREARDEQAGRLGLRSAD